MKALLTLIAFLPFLSGCFLDKKHDRTPAGWQVKWKDVGTEAAGIHTKEQLYQLFDAAMERSLLEIQAGWGIDPARARAKLRENDALYTLIDDYRFAVIGGPPVDAPDAKYATGETLDRTEVFVAFYDEHSDPLHANISAQAAPWTIRQNPINLIWYWGEEDDGHQYPALGYELHWQFTTAP